MEHYLVIAILPTQARDEHFADGGSLTGASWRRPLLGSQSSRNICRDEGGRLDITCFVNEVLDDSRTLR